jgi:hypothetical protein
MSDLDVEITFGSEVREIRNVATGNDSGVLVTHSSGDRKIFNAGVVATYGLDNIQGIKNVNENYVYEVCELTKITPPQSLVKKAVTIVDGPYWSLTPWPAFTSHVLTHVRYTPHARFENYFEAKKFLEETKISRAAMMIRDASRYVPEMAGSKILNSEYTIKTILRKRDQDDARPIFVRNEGRVLSILGSKIDNVYDVEDSITKFMKAD